MTDTLLSHTTRNNDSFVDATVQKLRIVGGLLDTAQMILFVVAAIAVTIVVLLDGLGGSRSRIVIGGGPRNCERAPKPHLRAVLRDAGAVPRGRRVGVVADTAAPVLPAHDRRRVRIVRWTSVAVLAAYIAAGIVYVDADPSLGHRPAGSAPSACRLPCDRRRHATGRTGDRVRADPALRVTRQLASGLESNFATFAADNLDLSGVDARRYKMLTARAARTARPIPADSHRRPRAVPLPASAELGQGLAGVGYKPIRKVADMTIYERQGTGSS